MYCIHRAEDRDVKDLVELPQVSNLLGANRSGIRNCKCSSKSVSEMHHKVSVQTYRVHANATAIESKLEKVPFHPRVLEHILEAVSVHTCTRGMNDEEPKITKAATFTSRQRGVLRKGFKISTLVAAPMVRTYNPT